MSRRGCRILTRFDLARVSERGPKTSEPAETNRSALASLAAAGEHIALRGGQLLFRQGAAGDAMYVLLSGRLRILVEAPGGPIPVGTVTRGRPTSTCTRRPTDSGSSSSGPIDRLIELGYEYALPRLAEWKEQARAV